MLSVIRGGRVVDPTQDRDALSDVWFEDGRIVAPPSDGRNADTIHDASGCVVLAGGIDIHSHIAGFNVNTARLLLPEQRRKGLFDAAPVCFDIGRLYAAMGFTLVVEPAVLPHHALQAQLELACIPFIDKAILAVLGNEDFLLRLLREHESAAAVAGYTARVLAGARALGAKTINPGGAAAFKANARSFDLDDEVPGYGVSSRGIMHALQRAVAALGLPHPLHLHTNNLGLPGNVATALATIDAAQGLPLHLAHLQFYSYGTEGPRGFSSAAPQLAEAVNAHPHITADVGQVMFGQTVTISCDTLRQFNARHQAHPRKYVLYEGVGNGVGVVPYRYRRNNFFNAVQWAAGLELFLLINDPNRILFTTDHPNGAPFTSYPDLLALLMDRELRSQWIDTLPKDAMSVCALPQITREYDWREIATMTRVAPARLLGVTDRGHLAPGARADIAVYRLQADRAAMFRSAALVFKDGRLIIRDGEIVERVPGRAIAAGVGADTAIDRRLSAYYEERFGLARTAFDVPESLAGLLDEPFLTVPCAR